VSQITVRNVVSRRTQEGLVEILHDDMLCNTGKHPDHRRKPR